VLFTGNTIKEVVCMSRAKEVLALIDVLIAGRYNASRRVAKGLVGSSNKVFHFLTDRYTQADFDSIPEKEITIQPDGTVIWSGIGWDLTR
jgi:hypothetical protein